MCAVHIPVTQNSYEYKGVKLDMIQTPPTGLLSAMGGNEYNSMLIILISPILYKKNTGTVSDSVLLFGSRLLIVCFMFVSSKEETVLHEQ